MENCPDLRGLRQVEENHKIFDAVEYGELPRLEGITTCGPHNISPLVGWYGELPRLEGITTESSRQPPIP